MKSGCGSHEARDSIRVASQEKAAVQTAGRSWIPDVVEVTTGGAGQYLAYLCRI